MFDRVGGGDDGGNVFQTEASRNGRWRRRIDRGGGPTTTTAASFAAAATERTMLAGGDAAAVQREVEELIARASSPEEAGASSDSESDAMTSVAECSDQIGDREILIPPNRCSTASRSSCS